jgi:hypothetical protein
LCFCFVLFFCVCVALLLFWCLFIEKICFKKYMKYLVVMLHITHITWHRSPSWTAWVKDTGKKPKPSLKLFYGLVKIFSTCERNANPRMYIIIGWTRTQSPNLELSIYFSYWQRNWRCHRYDISAMTESLKISLRLKNNPFSNIIHVYVHCR